MVIISPCMVELDHLLHVFLWSCRPLGLGSEPQIQAQPQRKSKYSSRCNRVDQFFFVSIIYSTRVYCALYLTVHWDSFPFIFFPLLMLCSYHAVRSLFSQKKMACVAGTHRNDMSVHSVPVWVKQRVFLSKYHDIISAFVGCGVHLSDAGCICRMRGGFG